jgi:hypothetical protein
MNHLPNVAFEAQRCFYQQFRSHCQIDLSTGEINMPEVCGEPRQQTLNVQSISIPSNHAVHRERVPQIVNPWLPPTLCRPDTNMMSELPKAGF